MRLNIAPEERLKMLTDLMEMQEVESPVSEPIVNPFREGQIDKIEKIAESTGIDIEDPKNPPINYSRYKTMVQDYLRAGNIPPSKVDLHRLKDGQYTLQELKDLIDTVKTNDDDAFYPTAHASISREVLQKAAESKISDMIKDMPVQKEMVAPSDMIPGGLADNTPIATFNPEELTKGIQVEMEHTNDPKLAAEIATDHLKEVSDYYTQLNESGIEDNNQEEPTIDMNSLYTNLHQAATTFVESAKDKE